MKYTCFIFFFISVGFKCSNVKNAVPKHFPKIAYDLKGNPLDSNQIELGRALFYDPILSKDNSISCSSCHSPFNAFAHTDHDLSHGINDSIGTRNAPALFNLAWQKQFMWDGAINHIDMQPLAPINHAGEMGETTKHVVQKLNDSPLYRTLFKKSYGTSEVTGAKMLKALTQFQLTLVSGNSKYDKMREGKVKFSIKEKKGYDLFKKNCNSCHQEPLFSTYEFANNGLPVDPTLLDFGRWKVTKKSSDSLLFKIPSLRNLSYSYPYMHDGRFMKLKDVLNHYNTGISDSPTLSKELKEKRIQLNSNEKVELISFLKTLNDETFVFNPKHRFPKNILLPKKE